MHTRNRAILLLFTTLFIAVSMFASIACRGEGDSTPPPPPAQDSAPFAPDASEETTTATVAAADLAKQPIISFVMGGQIYVPVDLLFARFGASQEDKPVGTELGAPAIHTYSLSTPGGQKTWICTDSREKLDSGDASVLHVPSFCREVDGEYYSLVDLQALCKQIGAKAEVLSAKKLIRVVYAEKTVEIPLAKETALTGYLMDGYSMVPLYEVAAWLGMEQYTVWPSGEEFAVQKLGFRQGKSEATLRLDVLLLYPMPRLIVNGVVHADSPVGENDAAFIGTDACAPVRTLARAMGAKIEMITSKSKGRQLNTLKITRKDNEETLMIALNTTEKPVLSVTYPTSILSDDEYWKWETKFKATGGGSWTMNSEGSIHAVDGNEYGPSGREATREVTLNDKGVGSDAFWITGHKFCGGKAVFDWTCKDALENTFHFTEEVWLLDKSCGRTKPGSD